ncbi:MAG: PBP1A family penicillin-binding protein [Candidatus Moranbacteria bacterium]|nr:PBP1A family penicillin-binding protein [Candidatus Moranbacteria bacterium]
MKKRTGWYYLKEVILGVIGALFMVLLGAAIATFFVYKNHTPSVAEISSYRPPQTSIIYDRTGKIVLYKIHGEENRKVLAHDEIPNVVRIATVATEDKIFYSHFGVDFFSILRAMKVNVENGDMSQGGSTITQQLARNVYLNREKTLRRKIMETLIAFKIEKNFTKDQILDRYLNQVPYGSNAYGIEAAAEIFFGKSAKELTLDEAVFLAALPKAPTYYSPYGDNADKLVDRYQGILDQMAQLKLASPDEIQSAKKINILAKVQPFREPIVAPHFVFYVTEQLEAKYGRDFLERGGLKIITTLDCGLQKIGEKVVADGGARNVGYGANNAALVATDPKTGDVLAMVGSRDFFNPAIDGQVNVAIRLRQPGSSFKPIVYATAFEKGYQPETLIADEPTNFGPDGGGISYIPQNYDGKFHGVLPMRKTLAMSLNIPAIKTLALVGIDSAIDMAHRLGITTLNNRKRYGLSMAIGGAEVKLIDMASAFGVFATEGKRFQAHSILEIVDNSGQSYFDKTQGEQVIDVQVARKINSILSDNNARSAIFGPNSPLYIPGRTVAAKTGTSQEFRDAWTVGYTPSIAVGVWAGNNDSRPMHAGSDGVFVAAPIWRSFMDAVLSRYPNEGFVGYQAVAGDEKVALSQDQIDKLTQDQKDAEKAQKKADKKKKKH